MKFINKIFIAMLLVVTSGTAMAGDELVFGSVAMDIPAVMHKRLKPLTKYLSRKLDKQVVLKLSTS